MVECLSPFMVAELVKPAAILSFHDCANHGLELASANFLKSADAPPMYVGAAKMVGAGASSPAQPASSRSPTASSFASAPASIEPASTASATFFVWP